MLVLCDPIRDGIWVFQNGTNHAPSSQESGVAETSNVVDVRGTDLVLRDRGTYEPASLAKGKILSATGLSVSSSPSSLENAARNVQSFNSRAVQANSSHNIMNEPLTPSPGLKPTTGAGESLPSLKDIHECFISAVLGSVVYFLCRDHGFVPLNSRTLILETPKLSFSHCSGSDISTGANVITLATLDISLTSLGTLVVKAYSDTAPGLQRLVNISSSAHPSPEIPSGTALWLAPGGNAAKFYGVQDEQKLPGNLPISQIQANYVGRRQHGFNGATIQSWQSKCLEWLAAKGLNSAALEDGGWVFVQVLTGNSPYLNPDSEGNPMLEGLTIIPWPALLCFQMSSTGNRESQSIAAKITERDPLSFAEEWFMSNDNRASITAKRQKERQLAEARSKEQADVDARNLHSITQSPTTLRRGSNAGAMYPTPPDAVHHPVGATPSFDGGVSTPGNQTQLFNQDVDAPTHDTISADIWGSSGKKERMTRNFHENDNDNDVLFRDSGDLFGDITDADFNFFDEPNVIMQDDQETGSPGDPVLSTQETSNALEMPRLDPTNEISLEVFRPSGDSNNASDPEQRPTELSKPDPSDLENAIVEKAPETVEDAPQPTSSPPFNKEAVFRRLFQASPLEKRSDQPGKLSNFTKIEFESSLTSVDEKYGTHGRFRFSDEGKGLQRVGSPTLPKTEYLSRRRKPTKKEPDFSGLARFFQRKESEIVDPVVDDDQSMLYPMDIDHASIVSEQDDTSHTTDDLSQALKPGVKRKWAMDDEGGDDMSSSFGALALEYAQSAGTPLSITGSQLPLLEGDPADWSLTTYFTSPEPDVQPIALTDLECIATAQILADQAVSGTIKLPGSRSGGNDVHSNSHKVSDTRELMHSLTRAARSCFKDITNCTMRSYLEIQGIPALSQGLRLPPRPVPNPRGGISDPTRAHNPFPINPPQLEVRRADSKLSVLPSAVSFWENLSLSPSSGSKDVNAVCVYPNLDGIAGNASIFLDQMRSAYESARLGGHDRVVCKELASGLVPFNVDLSQQTSKMHHLAALKETTARLSKILASLTVGEKNFVVYFIYPINNPSLLVHICSAFQHLFNLYRKALSDRKINAANELVLQLVPLDFIASPTSIVVPSPSEYARLAMEVYDRCIDFSSFSSTPAILLEQPLPKNIDFKLNANPSASLLQENSCLHIAYAQSIDDRWITAAWTDNRGTQQMTASYCLGRKNEPISMPFSGVANEIWETTLDIISSKKIHWRVMITRVGVMDRSEIEFWTGLASTESDAQINLTLITVQTDPSLRLLPAPVTLSPISNAAPAVVTPVSTPQASQASIVSPEAVSTPARDPANAATPVEPPVEPDSDARLIDYTDQSWGAVLAHRLNNSNSLLELNPALISGYLLKRGGINSDDPPIILEVNIVHSEVVGNPRTFHENLLREVLGYFRNLGTLARVRGVVDPVKDIRPWHVAAVEKAVKALYMLM